MNSTKPKIFVIGNIAIEFVMNTRKFPNRNESIKAEYDFTQVGGFGAVITVTTSLLGGNAYLLSVVGRDRGFEALEILKRYPINTNYIKIDSLASTTYKFTIIDPDGNSRSVVSKTATDRLTVKDIEKAEKDIRRSDVIVLELGLPKAVLQRIFSIAKENNIHTVIKPGYIRELDEDIIPFIDLMVLNETETSYLTGMPVRHIETGTKASKILIEKGIKELVIAFSRGGVLYSNQEKIGEYISGCHGNIIDNSISDFAFVGGLAFFYANSEFREIKRAIELAQCVSAYTMQRRGGLSSLPGYVELKEFVEEEEGKRESLFDTVLTDEEIYNLKEIAKRIRKDILSMVVEAGSGHPGGSLSIVELLTYLYFYEMNIYPDDPQNPKRDRLVLSKGHAAPALYAVLAERGFFDKKELENLRKLGAILQGHPDMKRTPGVDFSTGSLGQGLSAANGMALGLKLKNIDSYVYVIIGDGEMQEGEIWEAAMTAVHYKLDNLIAILDYNGLQIGGSIGEVKSTIEPVAEKWEAFGWHTLEINGHNFYDIKKAIKRAKEVKGKPTIIIAYTIKGKGISFMERIVDYHGKVPKKEELIKALEELEKR